MTTAIVLSGGGSRGDFELGALVALYEAGVRPDIICCTSVGAMNGSMLAHGELALEDLKKIWFGLQNNGDMYVLEDWWSEVQPDLRKAILAFIDGSGSGASADKYWGVPESTGVGAGIGAVLGPLGALFGAFLGATISGSIRNVEADAFKKFFALLQQKARALFSLKPIQKLMDDHFDLAKVAAWSAAGGQLRLATVSLKTGDLCYVTESGALLDRDQKRTLDTGFTLPDAALASSSIAGYFPPVNFKNDAWVDGGHRETIPLKAALQLGATRIYVISASPIDEYSAVNRDPDRSPVDYQTATIGAIAGRAVVEIHLDEMVAGDVYPLLGTGAAEIHLIAPSIAIHDILTVNPELIRISYQYGYMAAWDELSAVPIGVRDWASEIALNRRRLASLRRAGDDGVIRGTLQNWPGLWSDGIDAAVLWNNGFAYFFKGDQYIKYDVAADRAVDGYPVPIADNWPGLWPDDIDAAVLWNNGFAYFFKGDQYIKYDVAADGAVDGYPIPISRNWPGLPR